MNAMQLMMQRRRKAQAQPATSPTANSTSTRDLHLQRDVASFARLPSTTEVILLDAKDYSRFNVIVKPDEGIYCGGRFKFSFEIPPEYNMQPPKVRCLTSVFHPNIDADGHVCLNILREDWSPAYDLVSVVLGLLHLFYRPNADDPLDKEAAELMRQNPEEFKRRAQRSFR